MTLHKGHCDGCGQDVQPMGVEYAYEVPEHYDGVSEWVCPRCGRREGRWTGRVLTGREMEPRYGALPEEVHREMSRHAGPARGLRSGRRPGS